jgi:phthiocerol/phenolphthiocerol synthesis type-I polyketide synthase E
VLALTNRTVPPVAHFESPNVHLGLDRTPFYVPAKAEPWEPLGGTRRAGVSAFGIGGTNAHVVLEEAPPAPARVEPAVPQVLLVSAKSAPALDRSLRELATHVAAGGTGALADAAYTLRVGRTPMPWRAAVVAADADSAARALRAATGGRQLDERVRARGVVLAFPEILDGRPGGAGYAHDPVYRAVVDEAAGLLDGSDDGRLAAFVHAVASARAVLSRGIRPRALIGSGAGELAAGCVAGAFTVGAGVEALLRGGSPADPKPSAIPVHPAVALADLAPAVCLSIGSPSTSVTGDGERPVMLTTGIDPLDAVAALWRLGFGDAWDPARDHGRRRVPLPTYPFATTRHIIENR